MSYCSCFNNFLEWKFSLKKFFTQSQVSVKYRTHFSKGLGKFFILLKQSKTFYVYSVFFEVWYTTKFCTEWFWILLLFTILAIHRTFVDQIWKIYRALIQRNFIELFTLWKCATKNINESLQSCMCIRRRNSSLAPIPIKVIYYFRGKIKN